MFVGIPHLSESATRFNTPDAISGPACPVTPVVNGTWSATDETECLQATNPKGTTVFLEDSMVTWAAGATQLDHIYVTAPLASDTTLSGTFSSFYAVNESGTNDNAHSMMELYVVNKAGSAVRCTLLSGPTDYGSGTEYSTSLLSRQVASGDTITTCNALACDRIVMKYGHTDAVGGTIGAAGGWGEAQGSNADCPASEGTTNCHGWFEFSATFSMDSESCTPAGGPTGPANSGMMDFWGAVDLPVPWSYAFTLPERKRSVVRIGG